MPSRFIPMSQVGALIDNPPLAAHLHYRGVQIHNRIYFIKRPALPFLEVINDSVGISGDEIR